MPPVGLLSGLALADDSLSVFGVSATGDVLRYFWRPDAWYFENLTLAVTACTMSDPDEPANTIRVSVAYDGTEVGSYYRNGASALSPDGRCVAFWSDTGNLVPGDTNHAPDVFVHDLDTHTTTPVSVASDGTQAEGGDFGSTPALSADGRFVAFDSYASNLVPGDSSFSADVFVRGPLTPCDELGP